MNTFMYYCTKCQNVFNCEIQDPQNQNNDTQDHICYCPYCATLGKDLHISKDQWDNSTLEDKSALIHSAEQNISFFNKHKSSIKTIFIMCAVSILFFIPIFCLCIAPDKKSTSSLSDLSSSSSLYSSSSDASSDEDSQPILQSINASYSGSKSAGTVLDIDNEDISVSGTYADGSVEDIYTYDILTPKTLKAGKTSSVKITCDDIECTLNVHCSTPTLAQYKKKCKTISYKKLSRTPDKYEGKNIKFTGQIVQVMDGEYNTSYRINVTKSEYGYWKDTVYVTFSGSSDSRFLDDDIVKIYGKYEGICSYTTVLGGTLSVPNIDVKYIKLVK